MAEKVAVVKQCMEVGWQCKAVVRPHMEVDSAMQVSHDDFA